MESTSFSNLIEGVANLNREEYAQFLLAVNTKRAKKFPYVLSKEESQLLKAIYRPFSESKRERINTLNDKVGEVMITNEEHEELIKLIEEKEKWAARRMNNIAKLAIFRNLDYHTLVKQIGIPRPCKSYGSFGNSPTSIMAKE